MTETKILSGKEVASAVYDDLISRIDRLTSEKITPGLAAVLVGDDPASQVYVRNKRRRFENMGLLGETFRMGDDSSESDVLALINGLHNDDRFHGILIQLPLPKGIDSDSVLRSVRPDKDVDGFHPENIGLLAAGNPRFIPCTPKGILRILQFYNIETSGKHAVIVGRSNIVGRPMALMLSAKNDTGNATVTVCHSRTPDIANYTNQADIVIAAVGMPSLIKGDMITDGTVIIDVGINRVKDNSDKGYKLSGDVDYESVMDKASAITPVPGGVGPMTIAMLVENTVEAAERLIS